MRFDSPVGTVDERQSDKLWPGEWISAQDYGQAYPPSMNRHDYHTGADLNLNKPKFDSDAHAPVYACADGLVTFAGYLSGWGNVITIKHTNGEPVWSRYGHVENPKIQAGDAVLRGQQIAQVGSGGGLYPYHLHFDIAKIDLGLHPGDWPNTDLKRLLRDYLDPLKYIQEHHQIPKEVA